MPPEASSYPTAGRPNLDEFLNALDGFLSQKTSPRDPGYLKFLGTFCRSIGASEGHILMSSNGGALSSIVSFGMGPEFDNEFNRRSNDSQGATPMEQAYRKKEVMAIVELKKDPDVPPWFMELMKHHKFESLVAVPLLSGDDIVGVFCAYYHDVCLFDQGTLGHLLMIGRMVGAALEKSNEAKDESGSETDQVLDQFLLALTSKSFTKIQIYTALAKLATKGLRANGIICGPIRKTNEGYNMTIAGGVGVPNSSISHRFLLPRFLEKGLARKSAPKEWPVVSKNEWGTLRPLIEGATFKTIVKPLVWHNKAHGAVIGWRSEGQNFTKQEDVLLSRLSGLTSVVLNLSG